MVSMVHRETAGRVEAAVCMPMEDVRLAALCHFVQRINGDWWKKRWDGKERTSLIISQKSEQKNVGIINDFCL